MASLRSDQATRIRNLVKHATASYRIRHRQRKHTFLRCTGQRSAGMDRMGTFVPRWSIVLTNR
jgi:hypothetical protein